MAKRENEPGELVYFYAPKPLSTRFKKELSDPRGLVRIEESAFLHHLRMRGKGDTIDG